MMMMRLPKITGTIRRRILVNYRVDPEVVRRVLPAPFRPKLHEGFAVAGVCLICLDHVRPRRFPVFAGMSSENAAHRIAVEWEDEAGRTREGVFIPRRDTGSLVSHLLGGRVFPGEHKRAAFSVSESADAIRLAMRSADDQVFVRVAGRITDRLPRTSIFDSLADSSAFFAAGSLGYSVTSDANRFDGLTLVTKRWRVEALDADEVASSYFSDQKSFPVGTIEFDHALVMRDIEHEWHAAPELRSSHAVTGDIAQGARSG